MKMRESSQRKLPSKRLSSLVTTVASTTSSDNTARQVTRAEFQEVVLQVSQLKKDSQRQLTQVSQLGSELEFLTAQQTTNKESMTSLAELVLERTNQLQHDVAAQLQQLQVQSNQRITDVQLALERLEFRFKHHIRDCQSIAEQVDLQQDSIQVSRTQISQTQLLLDKHRDEQKAFIDIVQFSCKSTEAKASAAIVECTKALENFQQRIVAYVKKVEEDSHDPINTVVLQLREMEVKEKQQKMKLNQIMDNVGHLKQQYAELSSSYSAIEHGINQANSNLTEEAGKLSDLEHNFKKLIFEIESFARQRDVQHSIERIEHNVKRRIESVLELVALCAQTKGLSGAN